MFVIVQPGSCFSMLTTASFHWSGQPKRYPELGAIFTPQRLFYLTTNFFIPGRQEPRPMPWTVTLDIRSVQERKAEAFRQHTSQVPLVEQTKDLFKKFGVEEFYTLVAAAKPQAAHPMTDLFEGLV